MSHCRTKIAGAKEYCLKKKLTKECLYEKVKKYLVLTSDKVEQQGQEGQFFCVFWFMMRGFPNSMIL